MTIWYPDLGEAGGPRYLAIAEAIATAIARGELKPGERLPPQRALAWQLGVTTGTVGHAYAVAASRGLVTGEVGRGTYVRDSGRDGSGRAGGGFGVLAARADEGVIDLAINAAVLPWQEDIFRAGLAEVAASPGIGEAVRYMPTPGLARHRAGITDWLKRRAIDADPDSLVLTCGAQHALALAVAALTEPGQPVLTEALTFPGLLDAIRLMHRRAEPVAMDADGAIPDALDRAARETGARVCFLQPTLQNPTAAVMPEPRRRAIVEVARARGLLIVEDDVYGNLPEAAPVPLRTLAPERVVYVSSASKALIVGLRCGWILAPGELVPRLQGAAFATAVAQPATHFEMLYRWIADGTADDMVARLRREMADRQATAAWLLAGLETSAHPASFHLLLHLPEPWRGTSFVEAAAAAGVRIVAASAFAAQPANAPRTVRISVAGAASDTQLRAALTRLKAVATGDAVPARTVI